MLLPQIYGGSKRKRNGHWNAAPGRSAGNVSSRVEPTHKVQRICIRCRATRLGGFGGGVWKDVGRGPRGWRRDAGHAGTGADCEVAENSGRYGILIDFKVAAFGDHQSSG